MAISERAEIKLELDRVLERLKACCSCSLGQALVTGLHPSLEMDEVRRRLQETSEAQTIWRLYPIIPLGGIRDIRLAVDHAGIGGRLEPTDLLAVADTVAAARRLRGFCLGLKEDYPLMRSLAGDLGLFPDLEAAIGEAINDDGTVADHASPELARLRKQIRALRERVKAKLDSIIRSSEYQKMLQEALVTVRGDRYVVPVKQECRTQFAGLVHDQSASGATVFIEPMAVLELNNELRRTLSAEEREVEQILRCLTGLVAREDAGLQATLEALGRLDLIFAKGRYSQEVDGSEPVLNDRGALRIIRGRHPLLKGEVVPITVQLGQGYDTLVITGPNTGGKTVTLKTIGLLTLMAQCGLHVPAEPGSELAVFQQVFVDIGDEQSIEQSLSTFSSHMTNIIDVVCRVDYESLVLLDELGAGTDPAEGAALATAILDFLRDRGARTVATTHYGQLKAYAYTTPGVENASVEFDVETLRPTYRLQVGLPGRSNAFAIAVRLGLPAEIVTAAGQLLSTGEVEVADLIQHLTENRRQAEADQEAVGRVRREAEQLRETLRRTQTDLHNREQEILLKARQEAEDLIRKTRAESERVVAELRAVMAGEAQRAQEAAARRAREELKRLETEVENAAPYRVAPAEAGSALTSVHPGDEVEIPRLNMRATVLERPNAQGEVLVRAGIMKVTVRLDEIRPAAGPSAREGIRSGSGALGMTKSHQITPETDLRGLTVEEAIHKVDKYLDDAFLAGLSRVCLIHGKGTGALRAAIRDYLSGHPLVQSYRLGVHGEGGSGVTVVDLAIG